MLFTLEFGTECTLYLQNLRDGNGMPAGFN